MWSDFVRSFCTVLFKYPFAVVVGYNNGIISCFFIPVSYTPLDVYKRQVVSFITLLLTFLLSNITGMLPTEAISQCVMIAVLWLVICLVFYHMMNNVTVLVMMAVIGEAAIWIIYAVKSSLYESLLTNILNTLALSTRCLLYTSTGM